MFTSNFYTYKIEILDKEFITKSGIKYKQTARITFFNEFNEEVSTKELGYLLIDDLYKKIQNAEDIDVSEAFIKEFNINNILPNNNIELKNFNASESIFYSDKEINFSNTVFSGYNTNFENAIFLKGQVIFNNCVFTNGNVNFKNAIFYNGNISFYKANFGNGNVNFKNTFFGKGEKIFQYVNWGGGDINFSNCFFNDGNLSFVNGNFGNADISFKLSSFGTGNIVFKFSIFGDVKLSFERVNFGNGAVDFSKTEFGVSRINFNKSIITQGDFDFQEIEIQGGKFLFKNVDFNQGMLKFNLANLNNCSVYFDSSIFKDVDISFYKANVNYLSFVACQINNYTDLRLNNCKFLDLGDCFIHNIVDLSLEENPHSIKTINFFGCRIFGSILISWDTNNVYQQIVSNTNIDEYKKAWQFNLLKRNFNVIGQYDDEDKAYVEFRKCELRTEFDELKSLPLGKKAVKWLIYIFKKLIFEKMGLFATSPQRVFVSVIITWFIFGLLFVIIDYIGLGKTWSSVGNPDKISVVAQSFYHSAITFFTIGYGDVFPQGLSRIFSAIEGFIGVFMMSYFTVAFVRKVLR